MDQVRINPESADFPFVDTPPIPFNRQKFRDAMRRVGFPPALRRNYAHVLPDDDKATWCGIKRILDTELVRPHGPVTATIYPWMDTRGTYWFDDPRLGISHEPFVGMTNTAIDGLFSLLGFGPSTVPAFDGTARNDRSDVFGAQNVIPALVLRIEAPTERDRGFIRQAAYDSAHALFWRLHATDFFRVDLQRPNADGGDYAINVDGFRIEGWLCPVVRRYFTGLPPVFWVRAAAFHLHTPEE